MNRAFSIGCCAAIFMSSALNLLAIQEAAERFPAQNSIMRDQSARMIILQEQILEELKDETAILELIQNQPETHD